MNIALAVVKKYQINVDLSHSDSTSFGLEGKYNQEKITDNFVKEKTEKKEDKLKKSYQISGVIKADLSKIKELETRAGRFILATNRLD